MHHSEMTDLELSRLVEALAGLGSGHAFSATEALTAALTATATAPTNSSL